MTGASRAGSVAHAWAVPWWVVAAEAAAAVAFVAVGLTSDTGGRILTGAAAAAMALLALRDALVRPVLAVGPDSLTVAVGLRRETIPWHEVDAVRLTRTARHVVVQRQLEIDVGDQLFVIGALRLGDRPDRVLHSLGEYSAASTRDTPEELPGQ